MFYSTTLPNSSQKAILSVFLPEFDQETDSLPEQYLYTDPIKLLFITMHPDNEDCCFLNTYISPKGALHTSNTMAEAAESLKKAHPHKHNFIEVMFVLDGEIYVNIENTRHIYTKGSCYIINRNIIHAEEYSSDFRIVFLQLSETLLRSVYADLILQIFDCEKHTPASELMLFLKANLEPGNDMEKDYLDFIPQGNKEVLTEKLHNIFDRITNELLAPENGSSIRIKNQLLELFQFLSVPSNFSTTPVRIGSDAEYQIYTRILSAMMSTNGRISRSQLSEQLNYSGNYLNEISKKYSGLSLFDLGMTYCMKEAALLLTNTRRNITDIALSLGFTNRTHFYKIFKQVHGMTPAEYRRK